MKEENKRKVTNSRELQSQCDNNLIHDKDGYLLIIMAEYYQYILVQHSVGYHHVIYLLKTKHSGLKSKRCFVNLKQSPKMGHGGAGLDTFVFCLLGW